MAAQRPSGVACNVLTFGDQLDEPTAQPLDDLQNGWHCCPVIVDGDKHASARLNIATITAWLYADDIR